MKIRLFLLVVMLVIPLKSVSAQYFTQKPPLPCRDFAELPIIQGQPVKLFDSKGKVVVVGFWRWEKIEDARVKKYLQDLNQLQASQKKDVVVVGINYDLNRVAHYIPERIKSWGITIPLFWDNKLYGSTGGFNVTLSRPSDDFVVYVIDKKSKIRGYALKPANMDDVVKACQKLLAE